MEEISRDEFHKETHGIITYEYSRCVCCLVVMPMMQYVQFIQHGINAERRALHNLMTGVFNEPFQGMAYFNNDDDYNKHAMNLGLRAQVGEGSYCKTVVFTLDTNNRKKSFSNIKEFILRKSDEYENRKNSSKKEVVRPVLKRQIYSDYELNRKANSILDQTEAIVPKVMSAMGDLEKGVNLAKQLLNSTLPDLASIKNTVGANNQDFKELSTHIALAASGSIKSSVLPIQTMSQLRDFQQDVNMVAQSKRSLESATQLMTQINSLEILPEAREAISRVNSIISNSNNIINRNSGGCYIATFVYGDYEAEEVKYFRKFRDNYLQKIMLGRVFIKTYYNISPKLILHFGDKLFFKTSSKLILDTILRIFTNIHK